LKKLVVLKKQVFIVIKETMIPAKGFKISCSLTCRLPKSTRVQQRHFNIHEYQSMDLMKEFKIPTPINAVVRTVEEAVRVHKDAMGISWSGRPKDVVVKAQILAGGRGMGRFPNLLGGVHSSTSLEETEDLVGKMLGYNLVTKQTGPEGRRVDEVLIVERLYNRREGYLAFLLDRKKGCPVVVASGRGGVNIEVVAEMDPSLIVAEDVDPEVGITPEIIAKVFNILHFAERLKPDFEDCIRNLWKLYIERDVMQLEINPIVETQDSRLMCIDGKLNFDGSATFRQPSHDSMMRNHQIDPREAVAKVAGFEYIGLDGNIGCMVNGAGLAMATMDTIKACGGEPANFCDLGGGATSERVAAAYNLMCKDKQVEAILVNIFGGIMACDTIAQGIVEAVQDMRGKAKPVIIRLEGTNVDEGRKLIEDSGLEMMVCFDMQEAAEKAVKICKIKKLAKDAGLTLEITASKVIVKV